MEITTIIFYCFALVLVLAALKVITAKNPVHAALFLVLSFFTAAAIWMLLKAEFLAITLVLVYVGAVMVLFLFVVMMLDIDVANLRAGFWKHFPLAASVGALIALEMAAVLMGGFRPAEEPRAFPAVATAARAGVQFSNTKELGRLMYSEYIYPLEIAAVILVVAIVAAIALTLRTRKDTKHIDASEQVRVRARDRLQIIKVPPSRPTLAPDPATAAAAASGENKA